MIMEVVMFVVGLLLIVASMNSIYNKCNKEKDPFLNIIGIMIGIIILILLAVGVVQNLSIGIPILIDGMNIGEKYLVWSLAEEPDNQVCLRLEGENGKIKTYKFAKERIPEGLCANDTLTKMKDGTLHIHEKALTNQTMSIN